MVRVTRLTIGAAWSASSREPPATCGKNTSTTESGRKNTSSARPTAKL